MWNSRKSDCHCFAGFCSTCGSATRCAGNVVIAASANKKWIASAICLALCCTLGFVYSFPPTEYSFYPKCVLFQLTGLHCPGCGGTRALHHLINGRFSDACKMNVLTTLFLPILILVLVWQWIFLDRSKPFLTLIASPRVQCLIGMSVIAFGVARNLPWPPFSWLAPH